MIRRILSDLNYIMRRPAAVWLWDQWSLIGFIIGLLIIIAVTWLT